MMNISELMTSLISHYGREATPDNDVRQLPKASEHTEVLAQNESAYEFVMDNLGDPPTERFDRWRNRMPQG